MTMKSDKPEPEERIDPYLWDGSGQPDSEVEKLEALLSPFRYDPSARAIPRVENPAARVRRVRLFPAFAYVAGVAAIVVALVVMFVRGRQTAPASGPGWVVSDVRGTLRLGKTTVSAGKLSSHLGVGQVLETGAQSQARLTAEQTGQIDVDPNTRLRLVAMGNDTKRIALDHGVIHAFIWSPPGQFVVDTPSGITVDLGCAYTLQVDDSGAGVVRTSMGWVGFKLKGHESFIPAGAVAAIKPNSGPGTPYFEDASAKFRSALASFDFEDNTPEQRARDLGTVLVEARKRDALTLWHLLSRTDTSQRVLVYTRLARFVPPPSGVTEEGILGLDSAMLDRWWNELGFDDIAVWRRWERAWGGTGGAK
jgi:ferric-dicitrate binding protein FerR (iron transport regulator)